MANTGEHGITRRNKPKDDLVGYQVRLQWRGQSASRFFSDKKFGGPAKAFNAAVEYRNELYKRLCPGDAARRSWIGWGRSLQRRRGS